MFFDSFTWTAECYDSEKTASRKKKDLEDLKGQVLYQRRGSKLCVQPISCADCLQTREETVTPDKLNPARVCATPIDSSCN